MKMLKQQTGQGATEYIIILAVMAALLAVFAPQIKTAIQGKAKVAVQEITNADTKVTNN